MKLLFLAIILSILAAGCNSLSTEAQIRASSNDTVSNKNQSSRTNTLDISTVDFKNFSFPDPASGKTEKSFTLKNGVSGKKGVTPVFTLRKTYYFDITGDERDEAISHIIADGCQVGCESSQLFFVHTAEENKPKLLWKIAVSGDTTGGLKAVNFKVNEIVLEVFGESALDNWLVKSNIDLKKNPKLKTNNYTRFVFSGGENGFMPTDKDIIPLTTYIDFLEYRPQISFGK